MTPLVLAGGMNRVQLTSDAAVSGLSYDELSRQTRDGAMRRVRRGAYEIAGTKQPDAVARHLSLIEGTLRQTPTPAVVSHESAAVLHGLPMWPGALHRVHLTRDNGGKGKIRRYVHLHIAPLPSVDVCSIDGVDVTTLARTVVDLCRTLPMRQAVSAGDAALASGLDAAELAAAVARCHGWPGMTAGRRSVEFLDPRSESVGESGSRVALWEVGVATPIPQFEVFDALGAFVARSDFGWPQFRTLGEFDGRIKYGRLLKDGQTAGDVIMEEKRREDALRDLGWQVVRWLWEDLEQPQQLRQRLERAFSRGRRP